MTLTAHGGLSLGAEQESKMQFVVVRREPGPLALMAPPSSEERQPVKLEFNTVTLVKGSDATDVIRMALM